MNTVISFEADTRLDSSRRFHWNSEVRHGDAIYRLSEETLQKIFLHLPLFTAQDAYSPTRNTPPPGLAIFHVCRRWRMVVKKCNELWTVIPLRHPYLSETALRLSHPKLISIYVDYAAMVRSSYRHAVVQALDHLPRARVVSLRANDKGARQPCAETLDFVMARLTDHRPASNLESFSIYFDASHRYQLEKDRPAFHNWIPTKLHTLVLNCATLPHTSIFFKAPLSVLELTNCIIEIEDLLDALNFLPSLRRLALRELRGDVEGMPARSKHKPYAINLPRLEILGIGNSRLSIVEAIMNSMSLPLTSNIHLHDGARSEDVLLRTARVYALFQQHLFWPLLLDFVFSSFSIDRQSYQYHDRWTFTAFAPCQPELAPDILSFNAPVESHFFPQRLCYSIDTAHDVELADILGMLPGIYKNDGAYVICSLSITSWPYTDDAQLWHTLASSLNFVERINVAAPHLCALLLFLADPRKPGPVHQSVKTICMLGPPSDAHEAVQQFYSQLEMQRAAAAPLWLSNRSTFVVLEIQVLKEMLGSKAMKWMGPPIEFCGIEEISDDSEDSDDSEVMDVA
ncbi:hypothetical protein BV25DRAFT_1324376 [Artomyces pyxidatus]|uniref:Uncharacterized protein n=1 Tax=Artomyces pyxidatus TaxID=48021 RepID=A0ACB8SPZ9_9AGAM|nr:hypothetical protein BV25DRAFT_1324376 [Artomyces pyxidatus]